MIFICVYKIILKNHLDIISFRYPSYYANAHKHSLQLQPLRYSQVKTIVNGMAWHAPAYTFSTYREPQFNYEDWPRKFLTRLESATAEKLPPYALKPIILI